MPGYLMDIIPVPIKTILFLILSYLSIRCFFNTNHKAWQRDDILPIIFTLCLSGIIPSSGIIEYKNK
jgi:hypothetical protein